jgi:hypothetical protein
MASPNLAIAHIAENQNQKEVTVNTGIDLLDGALSGLLDLALADTNTTLTGTQSLQNMVFRFTGALTAGRNIVVPATSGGQTVRKLYIVYNGTTGGFSLTVKTPSGTGIAVTAGSTKILFSDGTNVIAIV